MSELKAVHAFDVYEAYTKTGDDDAAQVYLKSEVDRCFKELKTEIERLEILCANYRHDCDNLAISNDQAKRAARTLLRAARTLLKKMNYNKYKRCLAMAILSLERREFYRVEYEEWCLKWYKRWLAIAEKFK